MSNSTNNIRVGSRVLVTHNPEYEREVGIAGAIARRRLSTGRMGTVQRQSSSGFYVQLDGGDGAWWEPDELTPEPEHPAVTLLREIEWSGEGQATKHGCPICGAPSPIYPGGGEHDVGCRLAAILAGSTEPDATGAAVEAEREACAKIADRERDALDPEDDSAARHSAAVIAAGIRARGAK